MIKVNLHKIADTFYVRLCNLLNKVHLVRSDNTFYLCTKQTLLPKILYITYNLRTLCYIKECVVVVYVSMWGYYVQYMLVFTTQYTATNLCTYTWHSSSHGKTALNWTTRESAYQKRCLHYNVCVCVVKILWNLCVSVILINICTLYRVFWNTW